MRILLAWMLLISVCVAQPPKVVVDIAAEGQKAKQDDKPVLPDDFGAQVRSAAIAYKITEPSEEVVTAGGAVATLYTADGNWCAPCKQQAQILSEGNVPSHLYRIVKLRQSDFPHSHVKSVPTWVPDDGGPSHTGPRTAEGLTQWLTALSQKSVVPKSPHGRVFEVDGTDTKSIFSALEEVARREQDGSPQAVQGWLPAIPVDVDDSLLQVMDALLSKEGYARNGFQASWGAGKHRISFDPGMSVRFKKYVEVDLIVKSIEVDGRVVTLSLEGPIINTLTVRLK
jgi:hypothetical protein